ISKTAHRTGVPRAGDGQSPQVPHSEADAPSAVCGVQKANIEDESKESFVSSTEFPWVVSIQDQEYTHLAFGCILSEFWILSTASALQDRKKVIAVVGIANMDPRKVDHKEYSVSTIIRHEDFSNNSRSNNIALLKTESAIHFDDMVQAICFLSKTLHKPPTLKNCWVAGWNPTSATGNHMTMSILRRISVKDIDLCPLQREQKTECASHTNKEYKVCLGEPGSPMMCQVKKLNLWVLKGIVTYRGDSCPGLFLYASVEDYSDWIMAKTKKAGPSLSSLHPWEKLPSELLFDESNIALTKNAYSVHGHAEQPQSHSGGPKLSTLYDQSTDSGQNFRANGLQESGWPAKVAIQPMYYDYYGGEAGEGGAVAGQSRLCCPQERILMSLVLVFLGSGV
ncbi:Inactive serine protease 54, partial [Lemmus lemmus]